MNQEVTQTKPKTLTLDLSKGFLLCMVMRLPKQQKHTPNVFFAIGHLNSPVKIEVGLFHEELVLWLTDAKNVQFQTSPIPKAIFKDDLFLLFAEVTPVPPENSVAGETATIKLAINSKHVSKKSVKAFLGKEEPAKHTVGSDLQQRKHTAFALQTLILFNEIISEEDKNKISRNYEKEFKLDYGSQKATF